MGRDSDDARSPRRGRATAGSPSTPPRTWTCCSPTSRSADVTTSMTISGPAVPVFCMYVVAAERQGVDISTLDGTLQTDIFKEYIAQKEWLFPPEPHLRLIGDLMEWCAENIPAYKPLSVSGYHIREAGSTAAQELAYTLADGFAYVELGPVARPGRRTSSPPGCRSSSTRTSTSSRRSPSSARPGGSGRGGCATSTARRPSAAQWLRFHTQTAGVSLTAQQPYNNVVRTAVEALAAVLGGTNSLHTNALDEVLALPVEQAAEIALRTQLVLIEETGVADVADPLGGSWYVEALTDRIEAQAEAIFDQIRGTGQPTAPMTPASCAASRTATSPARSPRPPSLSARGREGRQARRRRQRRDRVRRAAAGDPAGAASVEQIQVRELAGRRTARDPAAVSRRARRHRSRRQVRREPGRADARGVPGRGHPRRDLRRPAHGVGHLHETPTSDVLARSGPGRVGESLVHPTAGAALVGDVGVGQPGIDGHPVGPRQGLRLPRLRTEQPAILASRWTAAHSARASVVIPDMCIDSWVRMCTARIWLAFGCAFEECRYARRSWHGPCLISVLCSGTPSESYFTKPSSQPASTNASPAVWQCTDTEVPMSVEAADARWRCSRRRSTPGRATSSAGTSRSASATAGNRFGRPSASVRCRTPAERQGQGATEQDLGERVQHVDPLPSGEPPQRIGRFPPRLVRRTSVPGPAYAAQLVRVSAARGRPRPRSPSGTRTAGVPGRGPARRPPLA